MKKLALLTMALVIAASTVAVAGVHLVGGTANGNNTIPFWPGRPGMRWQTIWRQDEIKEANPIIKVEFRCASSFASASFTGCKVLLCHTSLGHVTTSFAGNYAGKTPVTVFSGTKVIPGATSGTWVTIVTPTNFTYNNTDNLLIEISWVGYSGSGSRPMQVNSRGRCGRVYAYSATATTGSVTANYDQIGRLTLGYVGVAPTSLGRVKSIFK